MRRGMLGDFFEHIRNIAEDVQIDNIEILTCNTKIVDAFTITSHELMFHNFEIHGGGGTNLFPPLDYYDNIDSDNIPPDLMIYFTDLDGEFRKDPPDFPIVWVVIEHPNRPGVFLDAPYGVEVRYVP
jgi:predicted metal-dependent peptidase